MYLNWVFFVHEIYLVYVSFLKSLLIRGYVNMSKFFLTKTNMIILINLVEVYYFKLLTGSDMELVLKCFQILLNTISFPESHFSLSIP